MTTIPLTGAATTTAGKRTTRGELFTTAISTLGERIGRSRSVYGGAYEDSSGRESRLRELVHVVALENPLWVLAFTQWLRDEGNLRTVTQTVACEFVRARLQAHVPDETTAEVPGLNRTAINVACGRVSDVGELLDYWVRTYGRKLPMPVKRGAADALVRLTTERSALRGDGQRQDWRLGDVIELVHPTPRADWQSELFQYLLDRRRHGRRPTFTYTLLPLIKAHEDFAAMRAADPKAARDWLLEDPSRIGAAGLSWEDVAGLGPMDARAWQAVIPFMGYLALVRNLRNFEQAEISEATRQIVRDRLVDPTEMDRAKLFPLQFFAAAREITDTYRDWEAPLETAVHHSLRNIPELGGNTLVLVDVSGSMTWAVSDRSSVLLSEQAQVFGTALAMRCQRADLVQFDNHTRQIPFEPYPRGQVLKTARSFTGGGSTDTFGAVKKHLTAEHTRVVIVTDEQATTAGSIQKAVGKKRPLYIFNVAGYAPTLTSETMSLHQGFGGLTDQAFRLIPLVEAGATEAWPFSY
jgi:hypothetical protein